jgi:hypothetical protein
MLGEEPSRLEAPVEWSVAVALARVWSPVWCSRIWVSQLEQGRMVLALVPLGWAPLVWWSLCMEWFLAVVGLLEPLEPWMWALVVRCKLVVGPLAL